MSEKPQIDVEKLSPEDKDFFEKYGRLPPKVTDKRLNLKGKTAKFDSADHWMKQQQKTGLPNQPRKGE